MKAKTPIKIIKRDERNRQEKPVDETADRKSTKEAARDIVATVSGWVNEFQHKRRVETARAIKTLLNETTPQTSKA
jgi:hypothetical protein